MDIIINGEHEKCFAIPTKYSVLEMDLFKPVVHDSTAFDENYEKVLENYGEKIENVCLNSGYTTLAICKKIKKKRKKRQRTHAKKRF